VPLTNTRLGVAGLGWLGESLIKDALRDPAFEVVGAQDVVAERARAITAEYGIGWCGERFEDLLALSELDAVVICTPNHLHASQAQAAIAAGKDVLVQKPLALSSPDARRTVETAQIHDRLLFVDYTYRFLPTMDALRDVLGPASGIRAVRAAFHNIYGPGAEKAWFFDPRTSGGGALTDLGVHLLDLGLWLARAESVTLESANLSDEVPVEHAATLRLTLNREVPFDLAVSWNAPLAATEISLSIETESSVLRWENVEGSFFRFRALRDAEVLLDCETTLREDTLRAFGAALARREAAPPVDVRVYEVLDQAYGRS
jgi:predicted dehydrogenase